MAEMRYRVLGTSGVNVSEICLGTMMFGGPTDTAQARRIIRHARDNGVNFIDTADVYAEGRSEAVIGPAIKADRDRWVLATKVAGATGPGVTDRGLSRRHVMQAVDASLTQSGLSAGTPYYMAPEQARGEHVDHRADLFGLGSLLYVMCTGRPPFRAENTMAVLKRVC